MRLNTEIQHEKKSETIRTMLAFNRHKDKDLLVRNCMLLFNESEYGNIANKSPVPKPRSKSKNKTFLYSEPEDGRPTYGVTDNEERKKALYAYVDEHRPKNHLGYSLASQWAGEYS